MPHNPTRPARPNSVDVVSDPLTLATQAWVEWSVREARRAADTAVKEALDARRFKEEATDRLANAWRAVELAHRRLAEARQKTAVVWADRMWTARFEAVPAPHAVDHIASNVIRLPFNSGLRARSR